MIPDSILNLSDADLAKAVGLEIMGWHVCSDVYEPTDPCWWLSNKQGADLDWHELFTEDSIFHFVLPKMGGIPWSITQAVVSFRHGQPDVTEGVAWLSCSYASLDKLPRAVLMAALATHRKMNSLQQSPTVVD